MARDVFHDAVKRALEKDSWTITDDPLFFRFEGRNIFMDLGAESLIGARQAGRRIAVEVKSFFSPSPPNEFHGVLGQFLNYQFILDRMDLERTLYIAVPEDTFKNFFLRSTIVQTQIERFDTQILVYSLDRSEVVLWQE